MEARLASEGFRFDEEHDSAETKKINDIAQNLIGKHDSHGSDLQECLLELSTLVIKPLFSSAHPQVTPAGRKAAYDAPPTLPHAVSYSIHNVPKWKIPLTIPLLKTILKSYPTLPDTQRKQIFEAQFPLLVPPILNIIDDLPSVSRADGYNLLILLCEAVMSVDSDILKRTGLTDVFLDAIKTNFTLLPTLTPEGESVQVMRQLYPAALALIRARFDSNSTGKTALKKIPSKAPVQNEAELRQTYLKMIFRHGLLASLSHLNMGTSTTSVPLTVLFLEQMNRFMESMGLQTVIHLQIVLPMLRRFLCDPFSLAAPELLQASLETLTTVLQVCAPRIRDKWWPECLRGLVGCWCNVLDEEEDNKEKEGLLKINSKLADATRLLSKQVDATEWTAAKSSLCAENEDLKLMFAGT